MANIKPAKLRTGKTGKDEIKQRETTENELKGSKPISVTPPRELSKTGKRKYKQIISLLPDDFLSGGDMFVVGIVAEALDRMAQAQIQLNEKGLFNNAGEENNATKAYERYSKIFEKFSSKLGLSPKDRAALAVLNINAEEEKDDPVLNALRGDSD
jgi:P27 family predicted phage terminase small subunit